MLPLLLDTCAVIWLAQGVRLARDAVEMLNRAQDVGQTTYISPISAWEIGQLVSRRRLPLPITPQRWFAELFTVPHVKLAELTPALFIDSSFLPGTPPRDPADRIIAATARELGATLVTRDRALLDYGAQGHVRTMAC